MLNQGTYSRRLNKAVNVLETLRDDPDLAALFGIHGPDAPILTRGWDLYHQAYNANYLRQKLWGEAVTLMAQCDTSFQAARTAQARLTILARVLITAPSDRDRLELNGRRIDGLAGWRLQAEVFHTNLTDADRSRLAELGVTTTELERTAGLLAQLADDHAACIAAKAAAKAATATKTAAFQALAVWMSGLIAAARGLEPHHPKLPALIHMQPDRRRRTQRQSANTQIQPPTHAPLPQTQPEAQVQAQAPSTPPALDTPSPTSPNDHPPHDPQPAASTSPTPTQVQTNQPIATLHQSRPNPNAAADHPTGTGFVSKHRHRDGPKRRKRRQRRQRRKRSRLRRG